MKTFDPGSKSIIGLVCAKQAVEKHMSDLLAVSERNVNLKRFSPAEIAGVARRLLVMELKNQCSMCFTKIWNNPSVLRSLLSRSISRL